MAHGDKVAVGIGEVDFSARRVSRIADGRHFDVVGQQVLGQSEQIRGVHVEHDALGHFPTLRRAKGRVSRKGREKWDTPQLLLYLPLYLAISTSAAKAATVEQLDRRPGRPAPPKSRKRIPHPKSGFGMTT